MSPLHWCLPARLRAKTRTLLLGCALGANAWGCRAEETEERVPTARFGVFFGGQVQQLTEIPFELDQAKQSLGFRVEFGTPLTRDATLEWEVQPPRPVRGARRGGAQAGPSGQPRLGRVTARAGQQRLDHVVRLQPGDPLGVWNVRVVLGSHVLIDRPFGVYDPATLRPRDAGL